MIAEDNKLEYEILSEMIKNNVPTGASILALTINSSQATIGRKLQELEYRGLLEKQSNKGRSVTEDGKIYFSKLENDMIKAEKVNQLIGETNVSKKRMLEILYVRRILEKETAALATQNITEAEIEQLEKIINNQAISVAQGLLGDAEDLKFHSTLARISGNQVLEQILTLILTQKRVYSGFSYIRKKLPSSIVIDHKTILQAVKMGNAEEASRLMVGHIDSIIHDVKIYFQDKEIGNSKS